MHQTGKPSFRFLSPLESPRTYTRFMFTIVSFLRPSLYWHRRLLACLKTNHSKNVRSAAHLDNRPLGQFMFSFRRGSEPHAIKMSRVVILFQIKYSHIDLHCSFRPLRSRVRIKYRTQYQLYLRIPSEHAPYIKSFIFGTTPTNKTISVKPTAISLIL